MAERRVISLTEAADMLGVHPTTARRLAASGEFPGILPKLGGQWRVSLEALNAYIASGGEHGAHHKPIGA